jgi:hypothetical protein
VLIAFVVRPLAIALRIAVSRGVSTGPTDITSSARAGGADGVW